VVEAKNSIIKGGINIFAFVLIAYASYLLILLSLPYIYFERDVAFLETKQLIYHHKVWRASFYIHVFTSPIIIVSGLLQFSTYLQRKKRTLHRLIGKTYLITLLFISAPAAFIMSLYANGGRIAQTSFVLLSICWILTSWLALIKAKQGNIESHVKWMIRSYALTLSAITLRFYSYLFDVFQFQLDPKTTYILLSYISWIPNLLIAEILIRMKYPEYLTKRFN